MPLPKDRTKFQIQAEIDILKTRLDSLEETLHQEPWNRETRQDFRSCQNRLNSCIAEMAEVPTYADMMKQTYDPY